MAEYENRYWTSPDGLRLHARDYPGNAERPALVCLPGLTRNARDYHPLAARLAGGWRVIAVDFRGRGESAHAKDPMSYVPATYVADVEGLLGGLGIERFAAIGTSLGGIVTMLIAGGLTAGAGPARLAGALLNDVGPEIEAAGLSRIRGYVGRGSAYPTWLHAARAVAEAQGDVYPDWGLEDWLAMAKRLHRLNAAGRVVLDYDMRIAEPFRVPGNEAGPDMWRALAALKGLPVLLVRGERSDVLGARTATRMAAEIEAGLVTVPRVGHAPTLCEPALEGAIDGWLARVAGGA